MKIMQVQFVIIRKSINNYRNYKMYLKKQFFLMTLSLHLIYDKLDYRFYKRKS